MRDVRRRARVAREKLEPSLFSWHYLVLRATKDNLMLALKRLSKPADLALDVGSGYRPYEKIILQHCKDYVAFDIDRNPYITILADITHAPFRNETFDFVLCTQVLEHVLNYQDTAREIYRMLKENGICFVSVPFVYEVHGSPHDYWRFTKHALKEIFAEFSKVEIKASNNNNSTILQLFNYRLKSPKFQILHLIVNILSMLIDVHKQESTLPLQYYVTATK